ncbi:MAG TPA: DNA starvation/stationary phase protection protein [Salinimicrobium sp.]|nr:DNA starvation/stationary phase protection protein [Salinimicrobium sp.]
MSYLNLDKKKTESTVKQLNILLADYHMYYQKLRNFHWNIIGKNFFDLHEKFEELYTDAIEKVDEIAERILTLRHEPISNYTDFLKQSNLKESPSNLTDSKMISTLLEDHGKILEQMSKVVETADKNKDEGTIDLIGGYIRELEKTSWMLDAWKMKTTDQHKTA